MTAIIILFYHQSIYQERETWQKDALKHNELPKNISYLGTYKTKKKGFTELARKVSSLCHRQFFPRVKADKYSVFHLPKTVWLEPVSPNSHVITIGSGHWTMKQQAFLDDKCRGVTHKCAIMVLRVFSLRAGPSSPTGYGFITKLICASMV